jgi:hypothetical protein
VERELPFPAQSSPQAALDLAPAKHGRVAELDRGLQRADQVGQRRQPGAPPLPNTQAEGQDPDHGGDDCGDSSNRGHGTKLYRPDQTSDDLSEAKLKEPKP